MPGTFPPAFFISRGILRELSLFIDESGSDSLRDEYIPEQTRTSYASSGFQPMIIPPPSSSTKARAFSCPMIASCRRLA